MTSFKRTNLSSSSASNLLPRKQTPDWSLAPVSPFISGGNGFDSSCLIPWFSRKLVSSKLQNSKPPSLRTVSIFLFKNRLAHFWNLRKTSYTSDLFLKVYTTVTFLEKSSIIDMKYLSPTWEATGKGPHKYIWNSSWGWSNFTNRPKWN